jgi:DNA primase
MSEREEIDDLKARTNIVTVLEKLGARTQFSKGWDDEVYVYCPFCEDATSSKPAGRANPLKGLYFCFSCGFGADVIKLVQEHEGMEFGEAIAYLEELFPPGGDENPWTT